MNNEYNRMKALLEELGIVFTNQGISNAEIYAYSKGLEEVRSINEETLKELFLKDGAEGDRYCYLLNLDKSRYTQSALFEKIKKRLGMNFATYTVSDFESEFSEVGSGSYEYDDTDPSYPLLVFSDVDDTDLEQLGKFIYSYVFMMKSTKYDGNGLTWDEWESKNKTFNYYDRLCLQFNIIDYLRSDNNE